MKSQRHSVENIEKVTGVLWLQFPFSSNLNKLCP